MASADGPSAAILAAVQSGQPAQLAPHLPALAALDDALHLQLLELACRSNAAECLEQLLAVTRRGVLCKEIGRLTARLCVSELARRGEMIQLLDAAEPDSTAHAVRLLVHADRRSGLTALLFVYLRAPEHLQLALCSALAGSHTALVDMLLEFGAAEQLPLSARIDVIHSALQAGHRGVIDRLAPPPELVIAFVERAIDHRHTELIAPLLAHRPSEEHERYVDARLNGMCIRAGWPDVDSTIRRGGGAPFERAYH